MQVLAARKAGKALGVPKGGGGLCLIKWGFPKQRKGAILMLRGQ